MYGYVELALDAGVGGRCAALELVDATSSGSLAEVFTALESKLDGCLSEDRTVKLLRAFSTAGLFGEIVLSKDTSPSNLCSRRSAVTRGFCLRFAGAVTHPFLSLPHLDKLVYRHKDFLIEIPLTNSLVTTKVTFRFCLSTVETSSSVGT